MMSARKDVLMERLASFSLKYRVMRQRAAQSCKLGLKNFEPQLQLTGSRIFFQL